MTWSAWNSADKSSGVALSGGDLVVTASASSYYGIRALDGKVTGKFYFELHVDALTSFATEIGFLDAGVPLGTLSGALLRRSVMVSKSGTIYVDDNNMGGIGGAYGAGDRLSFAIDLDAGLFWARLNGGNWNNSGANDPATGTGGISFVLGMGMFPAIGSYGSGDQFTANFGGSAFTYSVPSGFKAGWDVTTDFQIDPPSLHSSKDTGVSSFTTTLNMRAAGIAVLCLYLEKAGGASTVSSVTSASITWSKRKQFRYGTSNRDNIEIWEGKANGVISSETVTVALTATTDNDAAVIFGVLAPKDADNPFDTNVAVPATANGSSTQPQVTGVSTTDAPSFIFTVSTTWDYPSIDNVGSEFSRVGYIRQTAGVDYATILVQGAVRTANYSSATVQQGAVSSCNWGMVVDAIKIGSAPPPVTGDLDYTEAIDAWLINALSPFSGDLDYTENPDTWNINATRFTGSLDIFENEDTWEVFQAVVIAGDFNYTEEAETWDLSGEPKAKRRRIAVVTNVG